MNQRSLRARCHSLVVTSNAITGSFAFSRVVACCDAYMGANLHILTNIFQRFQEVFLATPKTKKPVRVFTLPIVVLIES